VFSVYLGDRLGYYQALAAGEALTSTDLAARTGTAERFAREWLEHQAVTGILAVESPEADALTRRFHLPVAHREALVDFQSLACMTPMLRLLVGAGQALPLVEAAFRTGGGVPYTAYGEVRDAIAAANRPLFANLLGQEWLPAIPDVHHRLSTDPAARVADVGCGLGWSSIAIAQAYPFVQVDGFDLDEASIAAARENAAASGVADRVSFQVQDAGAPTLAGNYALACAFECIHDMSDPVSVLRAMRHLVGTDGVVLVADERVGETFAAPGEDMERLMYTFSMLHCLPVGMSDTPSVATGTVMRPDTLRRYAEQAGFDSVEILPIESDSWYFYRLSK
jgi:2-polyprenyl-3-methyl-5-hydroxy-6-metoxy-1,4-benzoquinol methylase